MSDADKPWIALMRTGYHVSMDERGYLYQVEDLERIRDNYDPANHRAPLFLDAGWHTNTTGDAAGWIDELRVNGSILEGRTGDVPPGVKEMVEDGRRRKVSVEVSFVDGRPASLFRVALLGASPPAITGLPELDPAAFSHGATMAFSKRGGHETAWVLMTKEGEMPKDPNTPQPQDGGQDQLAKFTAQLAEMTKRLDTTEAALTRATQDNQALMSRVEAAEGRANRLAGEADRAEIAAFTKGLVEAGKLPPGLNTPELAAFVAGLDNTQPAPAGEGRDGGQAGTLMFTAPPVDGQEPKPEAVSPRAFFIRWLGQLPQIIKDGHQFTAAPAGAGDDKDKYTKLGEDIARAGGYAGKKEAK